MRLRADFTLLRWIMRSEVLPQLASNEAQKRVMAANKSIFKAGVMVLEMEDQQMGNKNTFKKLLSLFFPRKKTFLKFFSGNVDVANEGVFLPFRRLVSTWKVFRDPTCLKGINIT